MKALSEFCQTFWRVVRPIETRLVFVNLVKVFADASESIRFRSKSIQLDLSRLYP
jgi:hypothetical protein